MSQSQPLVSKRISIAWPPLVPHHENTDTLVLTGASYFIDVRILHNKDAEGRDVLDWGIAGIKEKLGDEQGNSKAKWSHILNSRKAIDPSNGKPIGNAEDLADVGSMTVLDNGDVLETGSMFNPEQVRVMEYEEVWRDLDVPAGSPVCIVENEWTDEIAEKTFIGRIGKWQLGLSAKVVRNKEGVTSQTRYSGWRDEQESSGKWNRIYEFGQSEHRPSRLPDKLEELSWKESEVVQWEGQNWMVRELFWT
ncbi:hypothetical protein FRC03_011406 [Tulasnella sp. 419]|nr:hypothetical protein FRC03_011406 [Tulasnella sp. 419]